MSEHRAALGDPAPGPIGGDVVLRREGASVTLAQAPGLPQLVYRSFPEAVRVSSAFAAAHGVDVWCAVGPRWSLVATHRRHGASSTTQAQTPAAWPAPARSTIPTRV